MQVKIKKCATAPSLQKIFSFFSQGPLSFDSTPRHFRPENGWLPLGRLLASCPHKLSSDTVIGWSNVLILFYFRDSDSDLAHESFMLLAPISQESSEAVSLRWLGSQLDACRKPA
jgi:hypothetical protein